MDLGGTGSNWVGLGGDLVNLGGTGWIWEELGGSGWYWEELSGIGLELGGIWVELSETGRNREKQCRTGRN